MNPPVHLLPLIDKYREGKASKEELALINEWYHSFDDSVVELSLPGNESDNYAAEYEKKLMQQITGNPKKQKKLSFNIFYGTAAAVVVFFIGFYFFYPSATNPTKETPATVVIKQPVSDIAPGGNKATLTLADGSVITLDSAANGLIGLQGDIEIKKTKDGSVIYLKNGQQITENDEAFYNTITTPRGGQYQVTLSDGTKVWLNSASSIRFPVVFNGKERNVIITGEAYFEVFKNAGKPFNVKAENTRVEVLGTHFNINAYTDENTVRTTLLEGLVKISASANNKTAFLSPGQQSGVAHNGNINVIDNADTEEAVAWINGRFQFSGTGLKDILRQVARWYDVEVIYKDNLNMTFTGQLNRSENVSKVFEKLKLTGEVNFKIDGRTIIVSK